MCEMNGNKRFSGQNPVYPWRVSFPALDQARAQLLGTIKRNWTVTKQKRVAAGALPISWAIPRSTPKSTPALFPGRRVLPQPAHIACACRSSPHTSTHNPEVVHPSRPLCADLTSRRHLPAHDEHHTSTHYLPLRTYIKADGHQGHAETALEVGVHSVIQSLGSRVNPALSTAAYTTYLSRSSSVHPFCARRPFFSSHCFSL